MTNKQIITRAAIDNGIVTQAQAEKYRSAGKEMEIPLHSRNGWLARKRKVRDGEEPIAVVTLWQCAKESEANQTESGDGGKFYRHKTGLYTIEQTDRYIKIEK